MILVCTWCTRKDPTTRLSHWGQSTQYGDRYVSGIAQIVMHSGWGRNERRMERPFTACSVAGFRTSTNMLKVPCER